MPSKLVDREILKKFREKLDDKYVIEGEYSPETSVGISDLTKGIQSDREIDDSDDACPTMVFGPAGGTAEIQNGYQEFEELRGQSYALNQSAIITQTDRTIRDIVFTNNSDGSLSISGTSQQMENFVIGTFNLVNNHKYLGRTYFMSGKPTNSSKYWIKWKTGSFGEDYGDGILFTGNATETAYVSFVMDEVNLSVNCKLKIQCFDLTLMFGAGNEPTSALEFNRLFPLPYYAYNKGTLISSQSNGLESIGMNQFDGVLEGGNINASGQSTAGNSNFRTKNYIEVIPGEKYSFEYDRDTLSGYMYILQYDGAKNFIVGTEGINNSKYTLTLQNNCKYVRMKWWKDNSGWGANPPTTEQAKVVIRLYYDTPNLPYQPYEKQTIALPNIELRSAGSVYDSLDNKGLLTRRVGVVDLGTLNWAKTTVGGTGYHSFYTTGLSGLFAFDSSRKDYFVCSKYQSITPTDMNSNLIQGIALWSAGQVRIYDPSYEDVDAAAFKQAMSGVYLYYELATPTEEQTSDTFNGLVKVDNYGTLNFTSEQTIQCPQAYFIKYVVNLVEFLDTAYVKADGDANNLVVASELSAYDLIDSQLKNAIGGTLRQCLCVKENLNFANTGYVDLGTLSWQRLTSSNGVNYFYTQVSGIVVPSGTGNTSILSTEYPTLAGINVSVSTTSNFTNKTICRSLGGDSVNIRDDSYTDAATFKAAMKGVILAYEKA